MLELTDAFRRAYAGSLVACLAVSFDATPSFTAELERAIVEREIRLGEQYGALARDELKSLPVMEDYVAHYKRFKKSYHILLQLEGVAGGRQIPRVSPLVSAMFAAELASFVLTSGHDVDGLTLPMSFDAGREEHMIELLGGKSQKLKPGDIVLYDRDTPIAAVVYGQSTHAMISDETTRAVFVVHGVPGLDRQRIEAHLDDLARLSALAGPSMQTEGREVIEAG